MSRVLKVVDIRIPEHQNSVLFVGSVAPGKEDRRRQQDPRLPSVGEKHLPERRWRRRHSSICPRSIEQNAQHATDYKQHAGAGRENRRAPGTFRRRGNFDRIRFRRSNGLNLQLVRPKRNHQPLDQMLAALFVKFVEPLPQPRDLYPHRCINLRIEDRGPAEQLRSQSHTRSMPDHDASTNKAEDSVASAPSRNTGYREPLQRLRERTALHRWVSVTRRSSVAMRVSLSELAPILSFCSVVLSNVTLPHCQTKGV